MATSIMTEEELRNSIFSSLDMELKREPMYDSHILSNKVDDAIAEFKIRRGYDYSSLNDKEIVSDMAKHRSVIKRVALTWFNRIGSEGESYHYENTVHRSMWTDDELFSGVIPFVKVL